MKCFNLLDDALANLSSALRQKFYLRSRDSWNGQMFFRWPRFQPTSEVPVEWILPNGQPAMRRWTGMVILSRRIADVLTCNVSSPKYARVTACDYRN